MKQIIDVAKSDDDYVGLWVENDNLIIRFPMGYSRNATGDKFDRDDINNLIRLIEDFRRNNDLPIDEGDENGFPIYDYLNVLTYFVSHNCSYYKETEVIYEKRDSGKISWNKTIKKTKPSFSDGQAFYLSTIRRHNVLNDDALITEINKYCVYESVLLLGSLYGLSEDSLERPSSYYSSQDQLEYWIDFLKKKIAYTNVDSTKILFSSMVAILTRESSAGNRMNFTFRTKQFHVIWEQIIDGIFGTVSGTKKELFYPTAEWQFLDGKKEKVSKLRPDSILIDNNVAYIIDAKYYKYGLYLDNFSAETLPQSSSVFKQFAYVEYASEKYISGVERVNTISPFLLPYDMNKHYGDILHVVCTSQKFSTDIFVTAILFDTKSAIEIYLDNNPQSKAKMRSALINLIDSNKHGV